MLNVLLFVDMSTIGTAKNPQKPPLHLKQ